MARTTYPFRVSGELSDLDGRRIVSLSGTRAGAGSHLLQAEAGRDVVVLHIANGPRLRLHPAHAQALLAAGTQADRGAAADAIVDVPVQLALGDQEASRGVVGRIVLEAFEVFKPPLARLTALQLARRLEAKVSPGVHALRPQGPLPSLQGKAPLDRMPATTQPMLVLVHGTFSSTAGTFGALWQQHPQHVRDLFDTYGGGVYALEHESVTQSPFENAIRLLQALPDNAHVHLLTHSRGGLVAEVLARAMRSGGGTPFDKLDRQWLAGDDRQRQRDELDRLNALIAARKPRIERVLRVAAPARGTLLASGRLDAYLGVLEWALQAAGVPVLPELVDFATEVARARTRPEDLPGLEAMIPGRPVSRVLTREDLRVDSDLRVVAGDIQGDSVLSWLKVLATDAFYLTSHDLVVNTDAMYGGQARVQPPRFVFERGADVNHFRYFANASSAQAVSDGLRLADPPRFQAIGPLSWQGQASDGTRGGQAPAGDMRAARPPLVDSGNRPAVFVLPGIMGSHLQVKGRRIWLSATAIATGGMDKLRYPDAEVSPEEPIDTYFGDLMQDLSDTYDVIPFAFDWRLPIEDSARLLARRLDEAMARRAAQKLPVRVLAHSMGGLVMRTVALVAKPTWERFVAQAGARFVMAGTPNRGSFAPMLALARRHPVVNIVDAVDTCTSWRELREMMANFPGLIQLQMTEGAGLDLTRRDTWEALARWDADHPASPELIGSEFEVAARSPWGVPTQSALDALRTLRAQLDAQIDGFQRLPGCVRLVAGRAEQTIADIERAGDGVRFLATTAGDGTVPWASLRLPGVPCWRADAEHGDLLRERSAFRAYRELLDHGQTDALPVLEDGATRAADAPSAEAGLRPWRAIKRPYAPTLAEIEAAALGGALGGGLQAPPATLTAARNGPTVEIRVVNGDLTQVQPGLLVGHYRSEALTGAEAALDAWMGGTLSKALAVASYPNEPGQVEVFVNRSRNPFGPATPKPEAVIVAGLGDENQLTPRQLTDAVVRATLAWSLHLRQRSGSTAPAVEMAALLLGAGGWRIEVQQSAVALAQGVCEANRRLAAEGLPVVSRLTLVEIFGDRASAAHAALGDLRESWPIRLWSQVVDGDGARSRPVQRYYRGADYDIVRVQQSGNDADTLTYTVHSRRARGEELDQPLQVQAVAQLVDSAESAARVDDELSHALFNLLVPAELRPQLAAASTLLLDLDARAAAIPWELLRDGRATSGSDPLAVRVPVLRTLRLKRYRPRPLDNVASRQVLVIGEPRCDASLYPPLPGARREAVAVAALFHQRQWKAQPALLGGTANQVLKRLYAADWRILHIAGHGNYEPGTRRGGVVLDGNVYLGAREIDALGTVPELVFINCCHLGRLDARAAGDNTPRPARPPRAELAASLASELIGIGVRCVVMAGWAVDDRGAELFATTFYDALLQGRSFADAVQSARQRTWSQDRGGSTWAAYQCYGDPTWRLRDNRRDDARPASPPSDEAPPTPTRGDLFAALDEVAWDARFRAQDAAGRRAVATRLLALEQRCESGWPRQGEVAEAIAACWADLGELSRAEAAYQRALDAPDRRASLRAAEQRDNLRVRLALATDDANAIRQALLRLQQRADERPSLEAWSLIGSAHKRLALMAARRRPPQWPAAEAALALMTTAYARAVEQPPDPARVNAHYPRLQHACGLLLQHLLAGRAAQQDDLADALRQAHAALQDADAQAPDFWSTVGAVEWELLRSLALGRMPAVRADLAAWLADVHQRGSSARQWASVADTLAFVATFARLAGQGPQAAALDTLLLQVKGYAGSAA